MATHGDFGRVSNTQTDDLGDCRLGRGDELLDTLALLRGFIFLILAALIVGCAATAPLLNINGDTKNIILVIGDGMGAEQRKAAQWVKVGEAGKLAMDDMPAKGWSLTASACSWVTHLLASRCDCDGYRSKNRKRCYWPR